MINLNNNMANTISITPEQQKANYDAQNLSTTLPAKIGTSAITLKDLEPVKPVVLSPQIDNKDSYIGMINQSVSDLKSQSDLAQKQYENVLNQGKSQTQDISNLQTLLGGKAQDTIKEYDTQGVTNLYNQLADLNAQAIGLQNEAKAIPIQIQNEFAGRGATDRGVAPIESARLRDNALKALSLGQQAAIAQANYDKAKNYADQIVNAKYDKQEAEIKSKLFNLQSLKDFELTPAQEKLRQSREEQLKFEEISLSEKKKNEKEINDILITASQQGVPNNIYSKAKQIADNGGNSSDVAQVLGIYAGDYWGTKIKIAQYNKLFEKTTSSGGGGGGGGMSTPLTVSSPAQSWLSQFNSGLLTADEIYSKIGSSKEGLRLKNEVANLIAQQGGKRVIPMDDAQIAAIDSQIQNIDDLLGTSGYNYKVISGLIQGGAFGVGGRLTGAKGDALAIAKNLVSNQTLQALADAKAKGVTFGALSEAELNAVANSASRIASKIQIDQDTKEITGFSGSESGFKADLEKVRDGLIKAKSLKTGDTSINNKVNKAIEIINSDINDGIGGFKFN